MNQPSLLKPDNFALNWSLFDCSIDVVSVYCAGTNPFLVTRAKGGKTWVHKGKKTYLLEGDVLSCSAKQVFRFALEPVKSARALPFSADKPNPPREEGRGSGRGENKLMGTSVSGSSASFSLAHSAAAEEEGEEDSTGSSSSSSFPSSSRPRPAAFGAVVSTCAAEEGTEPEEDENAREEKIEMKGERGEQASPRESQSQHRCKSKQRRLPVAGRFRSGTAKLT